MARMLTIALFFAFLAISVNAQAPAATPETAPEALSPSIFSAETPEAEPAIPASSPSGFVEGPVSSIGIGAPLISESIAAAPDSETEAPVASPDSIAAAPSSWEYAPSNAPETAPSLEAPGSEPNDFADGPMADSPDTTIESPPAPLISDAPATAPSSDLSSGVRTETGFAFAGLVASVLVVAAF